MIDVKVKKNFIYAGRVYKTGEVVPMHESDTATYQKFIYQPTTQPIDDDLIETAQCLPTLDEPPIKRSKKNV